MNKKISEMTAEQQEAVRSANRAYKQKQRAKEKPLIPSYDEYQQEFAATEPYKTLNQHGKEFAAKVAEELGHRPTPGAYDYALDRVSRTLLSLKRNWIKQVSEPSGELVGTYFIDGCDFASDVIESVHRHGLKRSTMFAAAFRELLELLDKRYSRQRDKDLAVVQAELNGTYVPPAQAA